MIFCDPDAYVVKEEDAMTQAEARAKARSESTMYKQGFGGWIVSTWDPKVRANRLGHSRSYGDAREVLLCWRVRRALALLGLVDEVGLPLGDHPEQHTGDVRARLSKCVRSIV